MHYYQKYFWYDYSNTFHFNGLFFDEGKNVEGNRSGLIDFNLRFYFWQFNSNFAKPICDFSIF